MKKRYVVLPEADSTHEGDDSEEDQSILSNGDPEGGEEEEEEEEEEEPSTSGAYVRRADSLDSLISDKPEEKKFKRGVVYISFIPQGLAPRKLRDLLTQFAPVGRMYMQRVEEKGEKKRKKKGHIRKQPENYSEGWVEFLKKRHAKQVAALLNNQPIGGKKKDKFHDCLWNLKYLSRFKWVHLVERLSYEKAVTRQKMQNEVSQAKRVANFFKETVEREERQRKVLKRKGSSAAAVADDNPSPYVFAQRETVEEKKAKKSQTDGDREQFLKSLFS